MIGGSAFALLLATLAQIATAGTVERQIDAMSDEEKIAQLLIVGFAGQVENASLRELVGQWRVGGIVLFAHNIDHPKQVQRLNEAIMRSAEGGVTPFIAIDQEGGIVKRLRHGVPLVPSAMAIGATRSPDLARRAGLGVGSALRSLGFTMNFAPVLDVLTNHDNGAIGTRAFSEDPELVATLGAAFIAGQQEAGIIAVGKHYPGLGAVAEDSHRALPRLDVTGSALRKRELVPFAAAFRSGLAAIMTAHIALPRITGDQDIPATLSPRIMKRLLREEMQFQGIAITDALQMDALARRRGAGALALDAILAGSDMILALGNDRERREVFNTLLTAYRDGRLPKRRVREALGRILTTKQRLKPATTVSDLALATDIATRAITLVPGSAPLPELSRGTLLYIGPDGPLRELLEPTSIVALPGRIDPAEQDRILGTARGLARTASACVAAAATEEQFAIISRFRRESPDLEIVFVNLGSPWRIIVGPNRSTLLTYADDAPSQTAAARVLLGQAKAPGQAPIALSGLPLRIREPVVP